VTPPAPPQKNETNKNNTDPVTPTPPAPVPEEKEDGSGPSIHWSLIVLITFLGVMIVMVGGMFAIRKFCVKSE
jgi:hypothetical protein